MNKLNKFIKQFDVTDAEAAKLLGVSAGNLCNWKSGKRKLPTYIESCINLHLDIPAAHQQRLKELALR